MRNGLAVALAMLCLAGPAVLAAPEDGNHSSVFVADQFLVDDNLYRVPDGINDLTALVGPDASREDHVNSLSAGADGQWTLGRQAVVFDLRVDNNRFAHNDDLNNTSGHGKLVWNWRASTRWTGEAGAEFTRSLAGFANTRSFARDLIDRAEYFGTGCWQLGSHWAFKGGVRQAETTHSDEHQQGNNFLSKSGNVGLEYETTRADTFGWDYRYTKARFPYGASLNGAPFDRDYDDNSARLLVKYALTGKTLFDGSWGYLKRSYVTSTLGNFSGSPWRASLQWQPSAKTQVVFTGWRELTAYLESESDYFVARGGSLAPVWTPTDKFAVSLVASWDAQDYIGTDPGAVAFVSRKDHLRSQQASVSYAPRKALTARVSYRYEQRDSTRAQFNYDDRVAAVSLKFSF